MATIYIALIGSFTVSVETILLLDEHLSKMEN